MRDSQTNSKQAGNTWKRVKIRLIIDFLTKFEQVRLQLANREFYESIIPNAMAPRMVASYRSCFKDVAQVANNFTGWSQNNRDWRYDYSCEDLIIRSALIETEYSRDHGKTFFQLESVYGIDQVLVGR